MLTADAQLDIRTYLASLISGHLNQLAYTVLIQLCKRIGFVNFALIVIYQEFSGIVPGRCV